LNTYKLHVFTLQECIVCAMANIEIMEYMQVDTNETAVFE